jgi:hypothetical protein
LNVVQFLDNARYITNTVTIAIKKGARIDVINGGFFPPFGILGSGVRTIGGHISHSGKFPWAQVGEG